MSVKIAPVKYPAIIIKLVAIKTKLNDEVREHLVFEGCDTIRYDTIVRRSRSFLCSDYTQSNINNNNDKVNRDKNVCSLLNRRVAPKGKPIGK